MLSEPGDTGGSVTEGSALQTQAARQGGGRRRNTAPLSSGTLVSCPVPCCLNPRSRQQGSPGMQSTGLEPQSTEQAWGSENGMDFKGRNGKPSTPRVAFVVLITT